MKYIVTFLFHALLINMTLAQTWKDSFALAELKKIKKCRGSAIAFFHKKEMKEFTRLMNLARINPDLLERYVKEKYGGESIIALPWKAIHRSYEKNRNTIGLLLPSVGLHLGSFYHSVASSINGQTGHQYFQQRLLASLNFNTLLNNVSAGENVQYGGYQAIEIFTALMNSSGHRKNILDPDYMRVGLSRKHHPRFSYNTVTMFSGPRFMDFLLHPRQSKSTHK